MCSTSARVGWALPGPALRRELGAAAPLGLVLPTLLIYFNLAAVFV